MEKQILRALDASMVFCFIFCIHTSVPKLKKPKEIENTYGWFLTFISPTTSWHVRTIFVYLMVNITGVRNKILVLKM